MTMSERYTKEMHEAHVKAEEKKRAEEEQARAERFAREAARRAWIADGGDEASFERQWDTIRDERRKRRVVDADAKAREDQQRALRSQI
jgi:hypothetical protein